MMKTLITAAGMAVVLAGAAQAQPAQPGRRGADTDGDRRVSLAEMQVRHAERFARLDLNRDGAVTLQEAQAARQQLKAERHAVRAQREQQRAERRQARPAAQQDRGQRLEAMFARRDTNRDGYLVPAELGARAARRIARQDTDRDGRLSRAELQAPRQRAERGPRQGRGQGGGMFARLDVNKDGALTRAEFDARLRVRFERLDTDRDGFITRDERRAARAARG